jgi:hypothetical protein
MPVALIRILCLCGVLPGVLSLVVSTVVAGDAAPVEIVRLWTAYRDTQSFARLGQLPKVDDEPGDAIVLRSQPEARDGYYFTIRLRADALPDGKIVLQVIAPDAAAARTFTFPYSAGGQHSVQLLVGLTGSDWTFGETMPLAWKLEIVDTAGQVVGGQESFLWRKP